MNRNKLQAVIERIDTDDVPDLADIEYLLGLKDDESIELLFAYADNIREKYCGGGIIIRAIVEFSSYCRHGCMYCGLNNQNKEINRYRLSKEELLSAVEKVDQAGIKTVVLQSGEDDGLDPSWLEDIIKQIKHTYGMAVTLSLGERTEDECRLWKDAGADRYLLKIETANRKLYQSLHPEMSFEKRVECSRTVRKLGYQNGSGFLIGLKGQTIQTVAEDLSFMQKEEFDMIGVGLFIPHANTPLGKEEVGDIGLTLKSLAVTRILTKDAHLPVTTALGSIVGKDKALKAGANVIMFNFTPAPYQDLYEIYPDKNSVRKNFEKNLNDLETTAAKTNRWVDYAIGDSLKHKQTLRKPEQLLF